LKATRLKIDAPLTAKPLIAESVNELVKLDDPDQIVPSLAHLLAKSLPESPEQDRQTAAKGRIATIVGQVLVGMANHHRQITKADWQYVLNAEEVLARRLAEYLATLPEEPGTHSTARDQVSQAIGDIYGCIRQSCLPQVLHAERQVRRKGLLARLAKLVRGPRIQTLS